MGGEKTIIAGEIDGKSGAARLDKALAEATPLSRERIKALIAGGQVTLDGAIVSSASAKAEPGARFAITVPQAAPASAEPQDIALAVVHEDADLIVVDKPAGMVVHPAAGNADNTLVNALLHHCAGQLSGIGGVARPGIVHRIDKDTSGLLVAAKSDAAHTGLARQFADHSIERAYLAVVAGRPRPASGTIRTLIGRSAHDRKKMAVLAENASRGKRAVTHYRTLQTLGQAPGDAALVECRLETGRTHQIRVHMSSIGHMLLGDRVYGRLNSGSSAKAGSATRIRPLLRRLSFHRQALHAAVLGFEHPVTGDRMRFSSDLPRDISELIEELGG